MEVAKEFSEVAFFTAGEGDSTEEEFDAANGVGVVGSALAPEGGGRFTRILPFGGSLFLFGYA